MLPFSADATLFFHNDSYVCSHSPAHCKNRQQVEVEEANAKVEAVGAEVEAVGTEVEAVGTEVEAVGAEVEGPSPSRRLSKTPPHMYIIFFIGTPWVHQVCTGANTRRWEGGPRAAGQTPRPASTTRKNSTPRQEPAGIARNTAGGEGATRQS
jgi:hypothetical protein